MSFRFSSLLRRFRPNGVRGCANPVVKYLGFHHPVKYASSHALSKKSAPKNTEVKWASVKQDYHHHQHRNFKGHHYPFTLFAVSAGVLNPDDKDIKKDPKPKLVKSDANAVTVYIWLPLNNSIIGNIYDGEVGHVALKTYVGGEDNRGHYMSLWPVKSQKAALHPATLSTYDNDCLSERRKPQDPPRPPDVEVTLYSLDVKKINAEFERIKEKVTVIFSLAASTDQSSVITQELQSTNAISANCVKFSSHLLTMGGVKNLVDDSFYSSIKPIRKFATYSPCQMIISTTPIVFDPFFMSLYLYCIHIATYANLEWDTVKPAYVARFVNQAKQVELRKFDLIDESNQHTRPIRNCSK